jgi:hypothetical protein
LSSGFSFFCDSWRFSVCFMGFTFLFYGPLYNLRDVCCFVRFGFDSASAAPINPLLARAVRDFKLDQCPSNGYAH